MDKPQPEVNEQFLKDFKAIYGLSDGTKQTLLTQLKSIDRTIAQTSAPEQWSQKTNV